MTNITAIILTYNEQLHLERCFQSLRKINAHIIVVDSYSTDSTLEICRKYNVAVYQNPWVNHAHQINWAINNCDFKGEWIFRIDADEYLSDLLINNINVNIDNIGLEVNGIKIKRLMYFLDKPLKRGGMYPILHLRIWRKGKALCEQKYMDERMYLLEGKSITLEGDLIDYNLNDLTWWINKHNRYASLEAMDNLDKIYGFSNNSVIKGHFFGSSEERRRWIKMKYLNMPLFLRPFVFFIFRYFFQLAILDGKQGLVWTVLQCFWYRFLVDAKISEAYQKVGKNREALMRYFNL
ncbi:glycosyltransferase family 2 protein [Acinetobacter sp. YH16039]|jgi:glycosyltransferase involved in cell wall biosynthesis|uniref:glycosyltransferase family 2 protein n=1 Tax=Acinetobacter sp. YH16039 TaxID=2601184 RepID=UPI0015D41926|nr:glycosyltransferase family 2 protein [Acinetobacter sp. YH16039]